MKKCSKNSLKEWIRKIRTNQYRLPLLHEKLDYYNVKMIGYRSPSFEPRYGSSGYSPLSHIDYWLEKIWVLEKEIEKLEKEVEQYYDFVETLSEVEKKIVNGLFNYMTVENIINLIKINRNKYYLMLRKIEKEVKSYLDFIKLT